MSHDFRLTMRENTCEHCKRSDVEELDEYNISYNHTWIWYDKFDTKNGVGAIYGVPIVDLIPRLEQLKTDMIEVNGGNITIHEMNLNGSIAWSENKIETIDGKLARDDGWAKTNFNAYRCISNILEKSIKALEDYPQATW